MRYGYCTGLGFLKGDAFGLSLFQAVVSAGFDYVELPLSSISELSADELTQLEKFLTKIPCRACNLFFPPALAIVGPNMDIGGIQKYLLKMLPLVMNLGVETIVFGNGGARRVPEGAMHEDIWANLRTVVEIMDEHATKTGITIVVEPLNKLETNILNSYGEAAKLTDGLQNVATMIDSYHAFMENHNFDDVFAAPEKLQHLHTAYSAKRLVPSGKDDVLTYANFVQMVNKLGYSNKISIEGGLRNELPMEEEISDALQTLKGLFL